MADWDWQMLDDFIPSLENRGPLTVQCLLVYVLPSVLLYYLFAYLVLVPGMSRLRLSFLPLTIWLLFKTATSFDLSYGLEPQEGFAYLNQGVMLVVLVTAMRCIAWTFQQEPFQRQQRIPGIISSKDATAVSTKDQLRDALDLIINVRGHGWDWSRGLQVPPHSRPTHSRHAFVISTFLSFITHILVADHLHWATQWFSPTTIGSPLGGSIYDPSLSAISNFLRATSITFFTGTVLWSSIQAAYDFFTLIGVGVFHQHPFQWPPLFNSPFLSTSLTEFWARRWHQTFRDIFISLGAKPFSMLFGRMGGIFGVFFISAIIHNVGLWSMGRGGEFSTVGGFFLIQGIGLILEHAWRSLTGHRVGGIYGRLWNYCWVIGWGTMFVDAWCRKGMHGSIFHLDSFRPSFWILGPLPLPR